MEKDKNDRRFYENFMFGLLIIEAKFICSYNLIYFIICYRKCF